MEEQRWVRSGVVGGRKEGKKEGSERKQTVSDKLRWIFDMLRLRPPIRA